MHLPARFKAHGVTLGLIIGLMTSISSAAPLYDVIDLGGGYSGALNASGQVVGTSFPNITTRQATLFVSGGQNAVLAGPPGSSNGDALAINSSGTIVGRSQDDVGFTRAVLYQSGGSAIDLGNLGAVGYSNAGASSINNQGQIVGFSANASSPGHATLFNVGGTNVDLGTIGGQYSGATSINDHSTIVGYGDIPSQTAYSSFQPTHAVLFSATGNIDLGTLGGGSGESFADAVSNSGAIVGYSQLADGSGIYHATEFFVGGADVDLGALGTSGYSVASAVNDFDVVVGYSFSADGEVGFLWTAGTMTDLNALTEISGWNIYAASGINDAGQISASGCRTSDPSICDALLLDPIAAQVNVVPEPNVLWLGTSAMVAMLVMRRRKFPLEVGSR